MTTIEKTTITVEATINAPVEKVWKFWTSPEHIIQWYSASDDWHTPKAENNLRVGGKFLTRMEAKDGSLGFDFFGEYTKVEINKEIVCTLGDGRHVQVLFESIGDQTTVTELFEPETENTIELQKGGWQAILNNFKKHVETSAKLENMHFEITINAPVNKVYNTMLDKKGYSEWTSAFNPTSYFEGSWEKGSKILFIGTDQNGAKGGMVSRIKENTSNEFVSIEHLGMLKNGQEITSGAEVEGWAGATENYTFTNVNGKTIVAVELNGLAEFNDYFKETWPKALDKLKSICEN